MLGSSKIVVHNISNKHLIAAGVIVLTIMSLVASWHYRSASTLRELCSMPLTSVSATHCEGCTASFGDLRSQTELLNYDMARMRACSQERLLKI